MVYCYFKMNNKIFKQFFGILMGSDLAPVFTNLFLFYDHNKQVKKVEKNGIRRARKFADVFQVYR